MHSKDFILHKESVLSSEDCNNIITFFVDAYNAVKQTITDAVQGAFNFISDIFNSIADFVFEYFSFNSLNAFSIELISALVISERFFFDIGLPLRYRTASSLVTKLTESRPL